MEEQKIKEPQIDHSQDDKLIPDIIHGVDMD